MLGTQPAALNRCVAGYSTNTEQRDVPLLGTQLHIDDRFT